MIAFSLGLRASNSSATRGRPPVMSRVLAASRRDSGENLAALDALAFLDRQHRARRQHVAGRLAALLVEEGDARTQILLRASRAAIFGDHALGDSGRFVGLLGERLALDQILELHDSALLGDDRHHERIPLGDAVALRDDMAVVGHQVRAVGDTVRRPLAAVHVDDRQLARARHRDPAAAGVHDRRKVAKLDRCRRPRPRGSRSR